LSVDSKAREQIIFDFFDLLAAIAANGKKNGLGGRKLSRLAGWWAFEHSDNGGFEAGYRSWAKYGVPIFSTAYIDQSPELPMLQVTYSSPIFVH